MHVHFCGVRGSTPAPGADFVRYGGNTSCLALSLDDGNGDSLAPTLLLDAGTGIRRVGGLLDGQPFRGSIVLSHLHWDHVQGIPFFGAGDREGAEVTLFIPAQVSDDPESDRADLGPEAPLAKMMSPPNFPIGPHQLRGAWRFTALEPGRLDLADTPPKATTGSSSGFMLDVAEIPHKGGRTFGVRVSDGRSTLAYLPDHCPTALGEGPDGLGEYHPAALELAGGADVLVHDAHLVACELAAEAQFGHAAAEYAVALARLAGVKKLVLFHHRPDRTDPQIDQLLKRLDGGPVEIEAAAEERILAL